VRQKKDIKKNVGGWPQVALKKKKSQEWKVSTRRARVGLPSSTKLRQNTISAKMGKKQKQKRKVSKQANRNVVPSGLVFPLRAAAHGA